MKVLVAGSTGLVGTQVFQKFVEAGYDVVGASRSNIDFRDAITTLKYVKSLKPDIVIDAAANVGGILYNYENPYTIFNENSVIQNNLLNSCLDSGVSKFVFLGSSCIYPRDAEQPIQEKSLMSGPLEESNSAYAIAKISGVEAIKAIRRQFGLGWISLMPTNVYGPNDNFNLRNSHVLASLIRKFIEAKEDQNQVILWGDGSPRREFIYSEDLADAILIATRKYDGEGPLNIGTGTDISILDLALTIAKIVNYEGEILWDKTKPNGTPRKLLDNHTITSLSWHPKIDLETGIKRTIEWFLEKRKTGEVRL